MFVDKILVKPSRPRTLELEDREESWTKEALDFGTVFSMVIYDGGWDLIHVFDQHSRWLCFHHGDLPSFIFRANFGGIFDFK
jgi:hypothetical protein